jgi:hypothetical protein
MHYGMRSDRFPRLPNYEQALRKYKGTKPYSKGKYKGDRPLAERSRRWLRISKDAVDNVVITLYSTDVITYKPNGEIVLQQGGWPTATTHEVIARVLETVMYTRHKIGWIRCANGYFPLRNKDLNVFKRDALNNLEYVNPIYQVIHRLKVKEFNQIKKRYAEFIKYATSLTKLSGSCKFDHEIFSKEFGEIVKPNLFSPREIALMMESGTESSTFYKAYLLLTHGCNFHATNPVREMRGRIDDVLKRTYRNDVFKAVEVRDGRVVKDLNEHFFRMP